MRTEKEKFEHFLTICDDYTTTKRAFNVAHQAAKDIAAAVSERIEAERTRSAERLEELGRMINDTSRPASARRIWQAEFDQLQTRTFCATPDEAAAFDAEMSAAQEAVTDLGRLQREIREAIQTVNGAITELREQTLGDPCTGLWSSWIESDRKTFAVLCREVSL